MSFPIRSLPVLLASLVGCERKSEPKEETETIEQSIGPLCTCRGERGPAGPQGPQGPRGPRGFPGLQGRPGRDGAGGTSCNMEEVEEGAQITCGEDSYVLRHGAQGPQGERGEPGPAGGANFRWNAQTIVGRWNVDYYNRYGDFVENYEIDFREDGTMTPAYAPPFLMYRVGALTLEPTCRYPEEAQEGLPILRGMINFHVTYRVTEVPGAPQIFSFLLSGWYVQSCCGANCPPQQLIPYSDEERHAAVLSSDENRITFGPFEYAVLTR